MAQDTVIADRRLYQAADGTLVEAGDPRAASLYATPGQEIPRAEAERLGYQAQAPQEQATEPAAAEEPEPKQQAKPADKQRRASENK